MKEVITGRGHRYIYLDAQGDVRLLSQAKFDVFHSNPFDTQSAYDKGLEEFRGLKALRYGLIMYATRNRKPYAVDHASYHVIPLTSRGTIDRKAYRAEVFQRMRTGDLRDKATTTKTDPVSRMRSIFAKRAHAVSRKRDDQTYNWTPTNAQVEQIRALIFKASK